MYLQPCGTAIWNCARAAARRAARAIVVVWTAFHTISNAALDLRAERLLALLLFVIVPPAQARQP